MEFDLILDDTVDLKPVKTKKLRKTVQAKMEKLDINFQQVEVYIEKYGLYSVWIKASNSFDNFYFETDDSCLNRAISNCIKGFIEKCHTVV